VSRALSWKPLAALGLISYGVYVFHWPIFVFLTSERTGLDGLALVGLRLAITFAIALASYHFLEQPIRTRRVRLRPVPVVASLAAVTIALLAATTVLDRDAAGRDVVDTPDLALTTDTSPTTSAPPTVAPVPPVERVLFVGDSLVHQSYATLAARMAGAGIESHAIGGEGEHLLWRGDAWLPALEEALTQFDPQVVVFEACCGWGTPWRSEVVNAPDGTRLEPDTDASWREWARMAATLTDVVRAQDRVAVWVLAPPAQTNGYYGPVEGRIAIANGIYRSLAACRPGVGLVDWSSLSGPGGEFVWELPDTSGRPVQVRHPDGLHFTPEGQAVLADMTVRSVQSQWAAYGGRPAPPAACGP
jgi:hypothetical protein